ncbi:MAG TPA: glycoside hydrolase family 2 TIM barrel-domain containing protein, partial [Opitutaceae bacterium]|nr:glycoside hydrolase family 2 TIM barrel-domain containing protein [Opitutaceae bacterium]
MKLPRMCLWMGVFALTGATVAVAADNSSETETRYLSGTGKDDAVLWEFLCTEGQNSGVWGKIHVPSCWEQEGYGGYNYGMPDKNAEPVPIAKEQGKYRLNFQVPKEWKDKVVRLVFDGSMTDTEAWVNGTSAGPVHQGSFYRFKYDVSKTLKYGESNLLEVIVSKVSANESVNRAERTGDYWVFGGIFRPVYLEVLPKEFVDRTTIDARADGSFSADLYLGDKLETSGRIDAQIYDSRGTKIGKAFGVNIPAGQSRVSLKNSSPGIKQWTAETPDVYRVVFTLSHSSGAVHTVSEKFGFRTFEVRPRDGLYLNGQKIILKGVDRHSFWPETARTLSRQISYDDVRLIKEMNMNAVRMSHYPPDAHFLEVCDELGLYVLDELAGWHRNYDTPTGKKLIEEMIVRDVNHPSILFWDNGNEGGWNKENDVEFAKWDPQQRHVLHPWELFGDVNTTHYKNYSQAQKFCEGPEIYMPTEFMHGLYDGGAGAGLWDRWELMRNSPIAAGGFIWALLDEGVVRTDQKERIDCQGNLAPDGIVGPHREKEGSFYTIKEIWSPIMVTTETFPDDFSGNFAVENRYDFISLNQCK